MHGSRGVLWPGGKLPFTLTIYVCALRRPLSTCNLRFLALSMRAARDRHSHTPPPTAGASK